jgi:hypothetical protein
MNTIQEDIDMSTDEALISALSPKQLGEIELHPLSLMRHTFSIELAIGNLKFVHNLMKIWACTLSEDEILKAWSDLQGARKEAWAWADAQGYSILEHNEVNTIGTRLDQELQASTRARLRHGADGQKKITGEQPPP